MAKTVNIDYSTSDPRKIAGQTRQQVTQLGANLDAQAQQQAADAQAQTSQTQDYLGNLESPLAQGRGGYNSSELSQIQMTPAQQQAIVTGAGISAGTNTAASVGAADRAAAAAGGNPAALAAYRARAAQQEGSQAGDAMTQARIGASNAAAERAENIGQERMGQQNQALGYYGGLQAQQNANQQAAYGRQQQTYGTETSGLTNAANTGVTASQTPSTFDKVMGGIGGALSFLEEGDVMSKPTTPAVVGENGPEKIVDLRRRSRPRRSYLDGGDITPPVVNAPLNDPNTVNSVLNALGSPAAPSAPVPNQSFWGQLGTNLKNNLLHPQQQQQTQPAAQKQPATPARSMQTFGQGVGKLAGLFLADGGILPPAPSARHMTPPPRLPGMIPPPMQGANGVFTQPTAVNLHPNEAVVPLSYRAGAKVRPSLAALPAARVRQPYPGGFHGRV